MQKTINFSIALLLGLLIASAPGGGSAAAQGADPGSSIIDPGSSIIMKVFYLGLRDLFSPPPEERESERLRKVTEDYLIARVALREGDEAGFDEAFGDLDDRERC
jgi:hypothetical protein